MRCDVSKVYHLINLSFLQSLYDLIINSYIKTRRVLQDVFGSRASNFVLNFDDWVLNEVCMHLSSGYPRTLTLQQSVGQL